VPKVQKETKVHKVPKEQQVLKETQDPRVL
jgi:hypothetical protein